MVACISKLQNFCFWMASLFLVVSCDQQSSSEPEQTFNVVVSQLNEPDGLNPLINVGSNSGAINNILFQRLMNFDYSDSSTPLIPVLAIDYPKIETKEAGGLTITYTIRPDATWDDGKSITADDVIFSFKTVMCPGANSHVYRNYIDFIDSIRIVGDLASRKSVVFHCRETYMRSSYSIGYEIAILPQHIYDTKGRLNEYSFETLKNDPTINSRKEINEFANAFNSVTFSRDSISGSGAYALKEWNSGTNILLERKKNWWGAKVKNSNIFFDARPQTIEYRFVNEMGSISSLKNGSIDLVGQIGVTNYESELKQSAWAKERLNLLEIPRYSYQYIGLNSKSEKLIDVSTRRAIALAVNYPRMIKDLRKGYAVRTIGPIHPENLQDYNQSITPRVYSLAEAENALIAAGWTDENGDGIKEKTINGRRIDCEFEYLYNAKRGERRKIGQILQSDLKTIGINLTLTGLESRQYAKRVRARDYEIFTGGFVNDPPPHDFKQVFHTKSITQGSNYTGFGNVKSDSIITAINKSLDPAKRAVLFKELQQLLHDECTILFLWTDMNLIAVNKKFSNIHPSKHKPGYWIPSFKRATP